MRGIESTGIGHPIRTDNIEESLARLAYSIERGRPLAVLTGTAGVGKSTCLAMLADEVREPRRRVVQLSAAGMSANTLLAALTAELGLGRSQRILPERLSLLLDYLQGLSATGESAALLIDDLDFADEECWRLVRSLVRQLGQLKTTASVIATISPTGLETILATCRDQAEFVVRLVPWTLQETAKHALAVVQRHNRQTHSVTCVIDDAGLKALHECSEGIPGRLQRILELSLLACEELEETRVSRSIIQAAHEELDPRPALPNNRVALHTAGV